LIELFDCIPGIVFYVKDRESRFVACNSAMLSGKNLKNPQSLLGRTDRDFHPPALADAYMAEDRAIIQSGESLPNRVWFVIDRSGRPGWFNSSKVPISNAGGDIVGVAGVRYSIETPEDREKQFKDLAPVFRHLEERYAEPISMREMAKRAGISSTHFNRRFVELIGMSPTKFVHSLRIDKARQLLAQTSRDIADIAIETGYHDQSHFTRHFRQLTGSTPREWRMKFRRETAKHSH
ncbi:MAG: AraC family transcriptional regulator, partial [Verrucomicrobiota bacterium]